MLANHSSEKEAASKKPLVHSIAVSEEAI